MAWTSLSARLSTLPLVLAGPIVRKTTANSVSVWIALKSAASLELVIKSNPTLTTIASGTANTKAFGKNLHIALITVSGLSLLPNKIYHYDINFPNSKTLSSQGILESAGGVSSIVYGGHFLPSFILPSDDMSKLKILHCSCRKPHGGVDSNMGKDAFEAVSVLLNSTHYDIFSRPQQLYLTGDQIYADDVSDLLLFMLRDAENVLLGWTAREAFPTEPNPMHTNGTSYPMHVHLSPLHRTPLTKDAGFTSGEAKSHLLRLGEFYSMYLFVWSNVLWPQEANFPGYSIEYYYANDDPNFDLAGEYTEDKYNAKKAKLVGFKNSLVHVRKLLANISSYMIFDDHEVTDDWFLNMPWTSGVLTSENGKRIIQNGLSAYAVFQGWGNKPENFNNASSNENRLLNSLVTLNQHGVAGASQNTDWTTIHDLVMPNLTAPNLTGGIDWSYSLSFAKFNVIVLNTRTNRALFRVFAGLLSNAAMQSQIRDRVAERLPTHAFTLIIAPAPVFGLPLMEDFVQPIVTRFSGAPKGDYEPWSADRNKFEQFLKEISVFQRVLLLSGDVHYAFSNSVDFWDKRTGSEVRSKFVNLISSSLKNSASGPPEGTTFLADLVNNHVPEMVLEIENDGLYVGWNIAGRHVHYAQSSRGGASTGTRMINGAPRGRPNIHHFRPVTIDGDDVEREWINPADEPDWEYKIIFESDFRIDNDRMGGTPPTISSTAGTIGTAGRHGSLSTIRGNHTLVGNNNMGEIVFQWGAGENNKKILHKIWSMVSGNFIPLTFHLVDFGIASDTDLKPSEIGRTP